MGIYSQRLQACNFGFPSGSIDAPSADPLPLNQRVPAKILGLQAAAIPDQTFVTCGNHEVTYAEADRRANRAAHVFAGRGIANGSRVALLLRNRIEYLDIWFGLSRIGALQVPVNTEYKAPQIAQLLGRGPVTALVAEQEFLDEILSAFGSTPPPQLIYVIGRDTRPQSANRRTEPIWLDYESEIRNAAETPLVGYPICGSDVGVVINTSGTTGPSKGVLLSHAQQYILGRMIAADLDLRQDDVFYNCFPLFHNTAQAMITVPVLLKGARMVLTGKFSASRFWSDVREHGCTAFYYIGEIIRILLKSSGLSENQRTSLRVGWGIGASAGDMVEFYRRHGVRLCTGYGSTEANVPVFLPHDGDAHGSCGKVAPGFEIRIADPSGAELPRGETGEILVRSDEPCALMKGYDEDPVATAAVWRDLWLHTGDAGRMDESDNLHFMGRIKDSIRVRGENVSAFEVEQAIGELQGVAEVAAIAVPSELGGDDVKVVVVVAERAAIGHADLVEYARRRLPRFSVPRYVEFSDALPKTSTNKVQKHVLRADPFNERTWDIQTAAMCGRH